jgi:predicted SAM-dependent methyltransferase
MNFLREKKVLHVGCGPNAPEKLHMAFRQEGWREVRFDIDPSVQPDLVGSMVNMQDEVEDNAYDAVWSSHNIEHLETHETALALREFRRVLRPDGFALITCPDVAAIARYIVDGRFGEPIYQSPAGPISVIDMLWGHTRSIAAGNSFMAHRTGFTAESLGRQLIETGFDEVWVFAGPAIDLWAVALAEEADQDGVRRHLESSGVRFPEQVV